MIIVRIHEKLLKIVLIIALAGSLGFNAYKYMHNMEHANKNKSLIYNTSQSGKTSLTAFLASTNASAGEYKNIEIFDINKEAVVKRIPPNPAVQKEVEGYLKGITDICAKFNPIPKKGYMIKIPLESPIAVENKLIKASVDEVIIIFPEQEKPYLMLFDEENRALVFYFEGDTDELIKYIKKDSDC